ncbi:MAG: hypothetical protein ACO1RA_02465 [Planctomycetaceae bacterium]
MSTRCKFKVESVRKYKDSSNITLRAVVGGSPENDSFFRWTPSGSLTIDVLRPEIADQFPLGAEVYMDLTPVPVLAEKSEVPTESGGPAE